MIELTLGAAICVLLLIVRKVYIYRTHDWPTVIRGAKAVMNDAGVDYPGHMAFATKGGEYFHGCRVARFANVQALNSFFQPGNAGHLKLVAEVVSQQDGSLLCIYTNKLSLQEMEDLDEFNRNMHDYFSKRKAEREIAKQEAATKDAEAKAEQVRLAAVGKKYEDRVSHIKKMEPASLARKQAERDLNGGKLE